jgi:hypothetical protein
MKIKKSRYFFTVPAVLLLLVIGSCNMTSSDSPLVFAANGANLPAQYAIASGDAGLMLECLAGLNSQLKTGNLSDYQRGEIALDMIDILAVLSNAMAELLPFLIEGTPPANLDNLQDYYDASTEQYLLEIYEDRLMDFGIVADPSPMQMLWAVLAVVIYQTVVNGVDYGTMLPADALKYNSYVAESQQTAADGTNPYYRPVLDRLRTLYGETVVP